MSRERSIEPSMSTRALSIVASRSSPSGVQRVLAICSKATWFEIVNGYSVADLRLARRRFLRTSETADDSVFDTPQHRRHNFGGLPSSTPRGRSSSKTSAINFGSRSRLGIGIDQISGGHGRFATLRPGFRCRPRAFCGQAIPIESEREGRSQLILHRARP